MRKANLKVRESEFEGAKSEFEGTKNEFESGKSEFDGGSVPSRGRRRVSVTSRGCCLRLHFFIFFLEKSLKVFCFFRSWSVDLNAINSIKSEKFFIL